MSTQLNGLYAECILPLNKPTIRVLYLKPGHESDEIQAHLRLLDIDTDLSPQYESLSYVWGDPAFTKRVIINEHFIEIRKNLYGALRHIRSKTETLIIWADAICINQSDMDEKSHQVALMAEIYRRCSKVYIWLG
ncbi:hypothetical protein BU16DRAFT_468164, partial [Lophium mytilinum]